MIQVRVKFACFVTLLSVVCQSLGQAPPPSPGGGQGYFEVTYSGGAWSSTGEAGTVVGTYGPEQQENWGGGLQRAAEPGILRLWSWDLASRVALERSPLLSLGTTKGIRLTSPRPWP